MTVSSRGLFVNSGNGPSLQVIDIGHPRYIGLIDPDTAFWSLIKKKDLSRTICSSKLLSSYRKKIKSFQKEMDTLRFRLKPSCVYFNITERCNLNCRYCYIPENTRKNGKHMSTKQVIKALELLKRYFKTVLPKGTRPKVIFHGAEPLLNKDALFYGIEKFSKDFLFGIQTNAVLLDNETLAFCKTKKISIGLSLDGPTAKIADRNRPNWSGKGSFEHVVRAMRQLKGYDAWSVICTVTRENIGALSGLVDFFHKHKVPTCLLNVLRCTLPSSRNLKPLDSKAAKNFIKALERSHELYKKTGQKLVVANFANILLSILAPTARRLMCDISPCGGGRSFFAIDANGGIFPCSEFIGLDRFSGGNIFKDNMRDVLKTEPFKLVTNRRIENISPCKRCAVRHFCGAPCPAEAHEINGGMDKIGSFCEFYEEQARFAFRLIADNNAGDFLWDNWDMDTKKTF